MKYYLLSSVALLAAGCFSEPVQPGKSAVLDAHARQFVIEAEARGIKVDVSDLVIYFDNLSKQGVAGGVLTDGRIVIDSTSLNWKINPESVVFHEMGHKYLHRDHLDDVVPPTTMLEMPAPKSIMHSRFIYNYSRNREYFINELFTARSK